MLDSIRLKQRKLERQSNRTRFLLKRSLGKTYYNVDNGTKHFWWDVEELNARKNEFTSVVEARIQYDDQSDDDYLDCIQPWKTATQKEIEELLTQSDNNIIFIHCV